jgi:hypothetical protein
MSRKQWSIVSQHFLGSLFAEADTVESSSEELRDRVLALGLLLRNLLSLRRCNEHNGQRQIDRSTACLHAKRRSSMSVASRELAISASLLTKGPLYLPHRLNKSGVMNIRRTRRGVCRCCFKPHPENEACQRCTLNLGGDRGIALSPSKAQILTIAC